VAGGRALAAAGAADRPAAPAAGTQVLQHYSSHRFYIMSGTHKYFYASTNANRILCTGNVHL
jgi:hypothetical protein